MTPEEWSSCDNLKRMVAVLRGQVSERKSRLFNAACCRRIWHLYRKPGVQEAILTGERYADGRADREQLRAALRTLHEERRRTPTYTPAGYAVQAAGFVAAAFQPEWPFQGRSDAALALVYEAPEEQRDAVRQREATFHCDLLRELFGNPFRHLVLDPAWLTPGVQALAAALYEDRDFVAMPVLADALEEVGCNEAAVLDHLRGPNGHVRGCWALDAILGKE